MKSHRKKGFTTATNGPTIKFSPLESPFREFRDNELSTEYWGMGTQAFRTASLLPKLSGKSTQMSIKEPIMWEDEQTQPLPKSIKHFLDGWVPAEELAQSRWEAEVHVFDENSVNKISIVDYQLSHAQVLLRSSFCRKVLSACFNLERAENLLVEHQWESFNFALGPEGWRARYHIYSPGMKGGGGPQHRPTLSKNGCYLVRLFYLGCWRCVWVSDQVPVDASGSPLLPFSPLSSPSPVKGKGIPAMVTSPYVHLWPLLLCKALLKLAAPSMVTDDEEVGLEEEDNFVIEDETMPEFDIMHALTGCFSIIHTDLDYDTLWKLLVAEVRAFVWEDEYDDGKSSTIKSRSTKKEKEVAKTSVKDQSIVKSKNSKKSQFKDLKESHKGAVTTITLKDTKDIPSYILPGLAPALEMDVIVTMIRDLPLKRPLAEPEVALWKQYRWIDWARRHGLYEAYECPRTKFCKISGLMKLSYAPHLLDVQSTESITQTFREEQKTEKVYTEKSNHVESVRTKSAKERDNTEKFSLLTLQLQKIKEDLREWILFDVIHSLFLCINVAYYPSAFEFSTAGSNPPYRITRVPNRALDIQAPKTSPLYLQIDGPEEITLRISISMIHPRVLTNANYHIEDYIEKAYVLLECFHWFIDQELPLPKAYVYTRGYDSVEVKLMPGRHYCRLWVHSRMNWHMSLLSDSNIIMGTRDVIQAASCVECPWAAKFLNGLGVALGNLIRTPRSITNIMTFDRDFFLSYQPDLDWDPKVVGYDKAFVHWMFRQALQSHLFKRLLPHDYRLVCVVLRRYLNDPNFGFSPKPKPPKSLRDIVQKDPCDCVSIEEEGSEDAEEQRLNEENKDNEGVSPEEEKKPEVSEVIMTDLLKEPKPPVTSHICEYATDEFPCQELKKQREILIRKHEAATVIQSHWRGRFARKCLKMHVHVTNETLKILIDHVFGNHDMLSMLMNEFFLMFPGAIHAYSISSALNGLRGLQQHTGISPVTPICKWIPYFQGVFYCHAPVKAHFDVHGTIEQSIVQIYDNDTGEILPQAYNAHITFDIHPNIYGYTVLGYGSSRRSLGYSGDIHWQLTVLTSINNVFHVCDNNEDNSCVILPLSQASKLHIDEMYIPNRRNILGGIQISVSRVEAVSFRAAATSPNLEIEAILRTTSRDGEVEELARCHGKGEIFWPYIRLKPDTNLSMTMLRKHSTSMFFHQGRSSMHFKEKKKKFFKSASTMIRPGVIKTFTIEVTAPQSWALSVENWSRIEEVRQDIEFPKYEYSKKKEKSTSARDRKKESEMFAKEVEKVPLFVVHPPLHDDPHIEIECSTSVGGGAFARRDDDRDILYATALRTWDLKDPGRNSRGALIREHFREEFLETTVVVKSESKVSSVEEHHLEEEFYDLAATKSSPSPITGALSPFAMPDDEEVTMYDTYPDCLKEKFVPLYFVPLCTKDKSEEGYAILTNDMAEAAKSERASRMESALARMQQLQEWNKINVLGRQQMRDELLEKLLIDASWTPELANVMHDRNEAIAQELMARQQSAVKKKKQQETTKWQDKQDKKTGPGKAKKTN